MVVVVALNVNTGGAVTEACTAVLADWQATCPLSFKFKRAVVIVPDAAAEPLVLECTTILFVVVV